MRATEIGRKLVHRATAHRYLFSLELLGRVEDNRGIWYAKTGKQTIKPLEKEIIIELPTPKDEFRRLTAIEALAQDWEKDFPNSEDNLYRIFLRNFKDTRTIKITGKNVDDLDLEKLGNLIQQANQKAFRTNLKGLFKNLRRQQANNSQKE